MLHSGYDFYDPQKKIFAVTKNHNGLQGNSSEGLYTLYSKINHLPPETEGPDWSMICPFIMSAYLYLGIINIYYTQLYLPLYQYWLATYTVSLFYIILISPACLRAHFCQLCWDNYSLLVRSRIRWLKNSYIVKTLCYDCLRLRSFLV